MGKNCRLFSFLGYQSEDDPDPEYFIVTAHTLEDTAGTLKGIQEKSGFYEIEFCGTLPDLPPEILAAIDEEIAALEKEEAEGKHE